MNLLRRIRLALPLGLFSLGLFSTLAVAPLSVSAHSVLASEHDQKNSNTTEKHQKNKAGSKKDEELAPTPEGIDIAEIERALKGDGLTGEIHAADPTNRQFVLTFRDPKDFFNNIQLVMASRDKAVIAFFQSMNRHDRVRVKGDFFHQGDMLPPSPQTHIEVKSIEMVKQYQAPMGAAEKCKKTTILPADLENITEANFLVHAVLKHGELLVLEYKDNFVFVSVPEKDTHLTKHLFRNDRIHMRFQLQNFPTRPTHLQLDSDTASGKVPLKVLDSIHDLHAKRFTQEGRLVRFPKSPQINRDIWAVEQASPDGNARTFTLVNFTDKGEQEKIDAKLRAWWDASSNQPNSFIDGRNKLIHARVKISATGKMNVVDPNQANAQMQLKAKGLKLLDSAESIK